MTEDKTRVWLMADKELLGKLDELSGHGKRGATAERLLRIQLSRSEHAVDLELDPDVLAQIQAIAEREHRSVEGQIVWILENYLRGVGR